jgi:2-methylcitrate dehydratase
VSIDFPIGHRNRRAEGIPVLMAKFQSAIRAHLPAAQANRLMALAQKPEELEAMAISDFLNLYRV